MKRLADIALALALFDAALLFGVVTGKLFVTALISVILIFSGCVPWRATLGGGAQLILGALCIVVGAFLSLSAPESVGLAWTSLGPIAEGTAVAVLLLTSTRTLMREPYRGHEGTLGVGLVVFLACGTTDIRSFYPALTLLYLGLGFLSLHLGSVGRPHWSALGRRHWSAIIVILVVAGSIGWGFALALPPLYRLANEWALGMDRSVTEWHEGNVSLGSLRGMLQSDEVAMRVYGPLREDHLRGQVYREYSGGNWKPRQQSSFPFSLDPSVAARYPDHVVEIQAAKTLKRFFLPLDATDVHIVGDARMNRPTLNKLGVVRPARGTPVDRVEVLQGPGPSALPIAGPEPPDLQVPPVLREPLQRMAHSWVEGCVTNQERLDAIEARLSSPDFRYSLRFQRRSGKDPILRFLEDNRQGHCEYFATATTLLSRALRIPARMVTGYHVSEYNVMGGYYIVRERDAHAWVEAWDGDRWVTVDPSPLPRFDDDHRSETAWLTGLIDLGYVALASVRPWHLLVLLVFALAYLVIRRLRREGPRERRRAATAFDPPPRFVVRFMESLERHGMARDTHETLEGYAARLAEEADEKLREAAGLIGAYATVRYGGRDGARVEDGMRAFVRGG